MLFGAVVRYDANIIKTERNVSNKSKRNNKQSETIIPETQRINSAKLGSSEKRKKM
jgi:hypothetical protein